MNHPMLHAAGAAAVEAVAAGIFPMLGESYRDGEFAFYLLGIGSAAESAPGETVGVHAIGGGAAALAHGV